MTRTLALDADGRGQAVWVGATLLLALAIVALSLYQLQVVPAQNARVEYDHYQRVRDDFREFRRATFVVGHRGGTVPVTVDMSPQYPTRALASNPQQPTPTLRTVPLGRIEVTRDGDPLNVSAICNYGGAPVRTRALVYEPDYNRYQAPTLVYEHSTTYRRFDDRTLVQSATAIVENDTITLTPLSGSVSTTTAGSVTLDLVGGPVGQRTVTGRIAITIGTLLDVAVWRRMLDDEPTVVGVDAVSADRIRIRLESGTYDVVCYGIGIEDVSPAGKRALIGPPRTGATPTATPTPTPAPTATPTPTPTPGDDGNDSRGNADLRPTLPRGGASGTDGDDPSSSPDEHPTMVVDGFSNAPVRLGRRTAGGTVGQ